MPELSLLFFTETSNHSFYLFWLQLKNILLHSAETQKNVLLLFCEIVVSKKIATLASSLTGAVCEDLCAGVCACVCVMICVCAGV